MDTRPAITIKPSEVVDFCRAVIDGGRVPCLWGKPGIGKTALGEQLATLQGRKFFEFRTSLHEPTDLRAEMYVSNDGTPKFKVPDFFTYAAPALLLLDEANRGTVMMQNAVLGLVHERRVGDNVAPTSLAMVMCCNYESDGGGIGKMTAALGGRVVHADVVVDLDDWCDWAIGASVAPVVIAYNRFKRTSLHAFNPIERTGPSPRTWHMVSDIYKTNPSPSLLRPLVVGTVGQEEGIGFLAFEDLYRKLQATSIDGIILNPSAAPVPTDVNTLYAVSAALSHAMTADNVDNIITYLERLPIEYNVYAVKEATSKKTELQNTHSFTRWFVKHQKQF